ncbi:MAG TPA: hypothetical protein VGG27_05755 [Magnetospirillaceae bacterium]|jgi:hypothetical protein
MTAAIRNGVEAGAGGDPIVPSVVRWLGLAAAPTFAVMALWTAFCSGPSDAICAAMRDVLPLNGMTLMYALMSAFHLAPWLKWISARR